MNIDIGTAIEQNWESRDKPTLNGKDSLTK